MKTKEQQEIEAAWNGKAGSMCNIQFKYKDAAWEDYENSKPEWNWGKEFTYRVSPEFEEKEKKMTRQEIKAAYTAGSFIEYRNKHNTVGWCNPLDPCWNWVDYDYRVKKESIDDGVSETQVSHQKDEVCTTGEKKMFTAMFAGVMTKKGYFWRGLRFMGRQVKNYGVDGLQALKYNTKFVAKSAAIVAALGGVYLVNNTVQDTGGYKMSFAGDAYSFVSSEDNRVIVNCEGEELEFVKLGDSWVDMNMEKTHLGDFLDKCLFFSEVSKSNPDLQKPVFVGSKLIPTLILEEIEESETAEL